MHSWKVWFFTSVELKSTLVVPRLSVVHSPFLQKVESQQTTGRWMEINCSALNWYFLVWLNIFFQQLCPILWTDRVYFVLNNQPNMMTNRKTWFRKYLLKLLMTCSLAVWISWLVFVSELMWMHGHFLVYSWGMVWYGIVGFNVPLDTL